jgi:hypothetical protein
MRQFAAPGFRLWNLGLEAKILYTAFCVLTFLGVVSSALYYGDLVGPGTRGIRRYYAGEAGEVTPRAAPDPSGGPAIQVPADEERPRQPIVVPVSYRKLLEVTHFHLFTMPVVLLIVGHLFLATGLGRLAKLGWIGAAALGMIAHLATPWVVRYGSAALAPLHAVTGMVLTLTMSVLTLFPAASMWLGKTDARVAGAAPRPGP